MTRSTLSVLSLGLTLTVVGCDGATGECGSCDQSVGSDQDTEDCSTCGDDTSIPTAMAKLIVNSTFNANTEAGDVVEPCKVVIDEKTVGNTGEEIEIEPDIAIEVEVGILDGPRTTDDLPLHTLGPSWDETVWAGASVVTPKVPVTGDLATPQTVNAGFNLWQADTWWTCEGLRSWDGGTTIRTAMTAYTNGSEFVLPFGKVAMVGIAFSMTSSFTGEFISPIEAIATDQQSETAFIGYQCFTSNEDGDKVDADGNIVE